MTVDSLRQFAQTFADLDARRDLTPAIEDRAVEVQQLLADRGHHRVPAVPALLIAATAELAGLAVLHLDKDFDLIADVTGQEVQRLALDE